MSSRPKVKPSFLDLFVSKAEIERLKTDLQLRRDRKRAATSNATSSTETQPPVATPEEPPAAEPSKSEEPSTTEPPKAEESVPPPPEEPAAPTEEAKPVEEARTWTPAEDIALLSLKRDKMTWKEIGDKLGGIEKSELTKRYKELAPAGVEGSKDKGEGETTSDGESASTKENDDDAKGKSGKGGKGQAGKKGGKGKGQAAKQKESSGPENTDGAVVADRTEKKPKGILKKNSDGIFELDKATTIPDGATSIGGRPIIYLEDDDPIDMDDLTRLYNMNCTLEEGKWLHLCSRFFDQTGRRVDPDWLKQKFANCP